MNGYGKLYFDNGGYFEGQFVNGIANTNYGCFIYPDGSYYIGAVSNNFANGQGVYTYKNRTLIYKGNFVNDQPEGRGIEYYADGSRYEGDFRFGRKEGRGIFFWKDGTVYEGQFEGGFMQGYGVHKLSNGEVYEGEFRRNKRHGIGKHTTSVGVYNGNLYVIQVVIEMILKKEKVDLIGLMEDISKEHLEMAALMVQEL